MATARAGRSGRSGRAGRGGDAAKPVRRKTYHHGNLRRALIDESLRLIAETGPEVFTLREAARRVGVDHRAAYRHFEDKEALLAAIAVEGYGSLVEQVDRAIGAAEADDAAARLRAVARSVVLFAAEQPAYYRVMTGPRVNETGRFPELQRVIAQGFELLEQEIAAGVRSGELSQFDPRETAIALWALAHGIATLVLTRRVRVRKERLGEYVDSLVVRALDGIVQRRR